MEALIDLCDKTTNKTLNPSKPSDSNNSTDIDQEFKELRELQEKVSIETKLKKEKETSHLDDETLNSSFYTNEENSNKSVEKESTSISDFSASNTDIENIRNNKNSVENNFSENNENNCSEDHNSEKEGCVFNKEERLSNRIDEINSEDHLKKKIKIEDPYNSLYDKNLSFQDSSTKDKEGEGLNSTEDLPSSPVLHKPLVLEPDQEVLDGHNEQGFLGAGFPGRE